MDSSPLAFLPSMMGTVQLPWFRWSDMSTTAPPTRASLPCSSIEGGAGVRDLLQPTRQAGRSMISSICLCLIGCLPTFWPSQ